MRAPCPGCGEERCAVGMTIRRQPVLMNYRFASAQQSAGVARADVTLAQCPSCGLVFNATFDARLIRYDAGYENSQHHSATFFGHLQTVAAGLVERHGLQRARVLEIGCGKGTFLALLCRLGDNDGDGYDTTYEAETAVADGRVRYFSRYLRPEDVTGTYAAVVCRHVIEHVPAVSAFLADLRAVARAAGDPVVLLETPALEWICANGCFWDLFYEHCNYFAMPTLAWLARRAGFDVLDHRLEFAAQYQVLELRVAAGERPLARAPGVAPAADLTAAGAVMEARRRALEHTLVGVGPRWGIWGAGAKGVALANRLAVAPPSCLIDSNPAKQGGFVPGLATPIVAPESSLVSTLDVILIANPNYAEEVSAALRATGFRNRIVVA